HHRPAKAVELLHGPGVEHDRRRHAEAHEVREGVELGAESRGTLEEPRNPAIESVKDARHDDRKHRRLEFPDDREPDRGHARAEREHGEHVRNHPVEREVHRLHPDPDAHLWSSQHQCDLPSRCRSRELASAITVSPPITRWPRTTSGAHSPGKYTSMRLPNGLGPSRSPVAISWPSVRAQTMRRAIKPAICTTATSGPAVEAIRIAMRSFSSEALSRLALKNLPLVYASFLTRPPSGTRFTWTSNTLRNTPMRVMGASPSSNSLGGVARSAATTTPSAALTTSPARLGVTRQGSRKK